MANLDQLDTQLRLSAAQLLESEHLRDALTDAQAQQLLDWGLTRLHLAAADLAAIPDTELETAVDDITTHIAAVMRRVNRLVAELPTLDDIDAAEMVAALSSSLGKLMETAVSTPYSTALLSPDRLTWNGDITFQHLFTLINPPILAQSPTPEPPSAMYKDEEE